MLNDLKFGFRQLLKHPGGFPRGKPRADISSRRFGHWPGRFSLIPTLPRSDAPRLDEL